MAHFISNLNSVIPFAVLGASLMGSGHCVGMCGGLVVSVVRDKRSMAFYHLARLFGYCGLGGIAGFLGAETLGAERFIFLSWLSSFFLAMGFILLGIQVWRGKPLHLFRLPHSFWRRLTTMGPAATGFLSAFLPCGWLHTFVLGAVATQSARSGVVFLFFFWLGTLPALGLGPIALKKVLQPVGSQLPRISASILILTGLGSLMLKSLPENLGGVRHCHLEERSESHFALKALGKFFQF